jgi:plasmid stabilization system protein ParE
MVIILWSDRARSNLDRLDEFLRVKNPRAATAALTSIRDGVMAIEQFPLSGRPLPDNPVNVREWLVLYGSGGYRIRYRIDGDAITVLAIRHTREAGFQQ